jgi:hypothetical protein
LRLSVVMWINSARYSGISCSTRLHNRVQRLFFGSLKKRLDCVL